MMNKCAYEGCDQPPHKDGVIDAKVLVGEAIVETRLRICLKHMGMIQSPRDLEHLSVVIEPPSFNAKTWLAKREEEMRHQATRHNVFDDAKENRGESGGLPIL